MQPAENLARPEWLHEIKRPVQKTATRPPQILSKCLNRPAARLGLCLILCAALLLIFRANTFNQYEKRPVGDASYFTEMTEAFYLGEPPELQFPTLHSRRILGPWLAAKICGAMDWIQGRKHSSPFHYGYYAEDYFKKWKPEDSLTYNRILCAWKTLNAMALLAIFVSLFGVLEHFRPKQPPNASAYNDVSRESSPAISWHGIWLALILCCSPVLGRLYFIWPIMNDLVGISLGLLAFLCLLKKRTLLSGALFGAGMLARENLALIYPCFWWILFNRDQKRTPPINPRQCLLHGLLSFGPYALLCAFPIFDNIGPLQDWSSGIQGTASGATHDYWAIALYHLRRPFVADHGFQRQVLVYWHVFGPILALTLRFYPWNRLREDALLGVGFLATLATSFYVDRYVVYALFPLLLLARHALIHRFSALLAVSLSFCFLKTVDFFAEIGSATSLQVEFMDAARLKSTAFWAACALLVIFLHPLLRFWPASVLRQTPEQAPA